MVAVARRLALFVLEGLERTGDTLDSLLASALGTAPHLSQKDRALTTELVFGVVRWQGRLDWVIRNTSSLAFHKIDPRILQILRMGLYQVFFLSKIPHAVAVDEAVKLAREKSSKWVAGYVNGVLRTAIRRANDTTFLDGQDDPVSTLCVMESHPRWLVERWVKRMGLEKTEKLCQANNRIPPVTIRVNTLKTTREVLANILAPLVQEIRTTMYSPDGLILKGLRQPIGDMAPFQQGLFQVQDEAAQLISIFLDPQPRENVLDGCAGYGGKTGHIAQLMKDAGIITAVDNREGKLEALQRAMSRQGISCVKAWHCDMSSPFAHEAFCSYDRILLDAPCTGLGVIRRNPDIKWKRTAEDLVKSGDRQMKLLETVAPLVKKGGLLVYSVCSMEPEEGENVIEGFLKTHRDFAIDDAFSGCRDNAGAFGDRPGVFQSLPHEHDMDGFFAVRLRRSTNGCDR